jgi:hypothetical protein
MLSHRLRGDKVIALRILNLSPRNGWVFNSTPWPLYPLKKPSTLCTGGLVAVGIGLAR